MLVEHNSFVKVIQEGCWPTPTMSDLQRRSSLYRAGVRWVTEVASSGLSMSSAMHYVIVMSNYLLASATAHTQHAANLYSAYTSKAKCDSKMDICV